jgi:hypothetical protein
MISKGRSEFENNHKTVLETWNSIRIPESSPPASSAAAALLRRCKMSAAMCMDSMLPNRERNTRAVRHAQFC